MNRKIYIVFILVMLLSAVASAQNKAKLVRRGNKLYDKEKYNEAEILYRKSMEQDSNYYKSRYNLANSLYKQDKYDESIDYYQKILKSKDIDNDLKAKALYNIGNSYVQKGELDKGIEAYKNSLRINPNDLEAKYNLSYAYKLKQKLPPPPPQENKDNKPPEDPSDFAKKLKQQADELVKQYKYKEAYNLMIEGLKKDETVGYFNEFIQKLYDVVKIENAL